MKISTSFLKKQFPNVKGNFNNNLSIERVYTDSRESLKNGLFVPIKGERFNAHDFILQAYENGAVASLWDQDEPIPEDLPDSFTLYIVEDTIKALQELALAYRQEVNPYVIGITGSNGKTTTKEMVASTLSNFMKVEKTEGNLNNHIGLPLSIMAMDEDTEILVLEMGMSNFGEIETLSKIAQPNIAIITNIGESHIEYLGSRKGIAKAKLEITSGLLKDGLLIIDGDEPLLQQQHLLRTVTCGMEASNDYTVDQVKISDKQTSFLINGEPFFIPLLGTHQAKNAAFVFAVGKELSINPKEIQTALSALQLPSMRFEQIKTDSGALVINDAYNASATSMKASIEVVKQMKAKRKVLILGDIFELGSFSKQEHEKVAHVIDDSIDVVLTHGKDAKYIHDALGSHFTGDHRYFSTLDDLMDALTGYLDEGTVILLKASRGMKFEQLLEKVQTS
ncbi:UDP-N-acetylmuramoyl-tripeptide--D-alanyl-D-alanine ligase [Halalkalibacillus halophilus]|uniref:UDP-N-acetylmuramoyl-tripeptide--D-alanyl-D- alanine ligase n=1 Tax=Halalkalibacillus halophilus TaxID=392827 RepID=UPI00041CBCC8|nr:UDP-N-acetylmuramoyl-tripeptide--D-alanyl-D-alanine ligase [Halalkalibacillus halophilus]